MTETWILWLSVLIGFVGLAVVAAIVWFGHVMLRTHRKLWGHPFWDEMFHRWFEAPPHHDEIPRYLSEGYSEYLQRRNEFWTTYGQVLVAVLMIIVLTILLLTKVISAEAGLPILSGISGFAIAKGVSGTKTINVPREGPRG